MRLLVIIGLLLSALDAEAAVPKKCPKRCCSMLARENSRLRAQLKRLEPPVPARPGKIDFVDDPVEGLPDVVIEFVD